MKKLFTTLYGSGLYGTKTPTSDRDLKHIVLPPLNDLLLGKRIDNKVKKTNTVANTRNGVDDVDEEFITLQTFARHFIEGQTYAIELAFAIDGNHAEQTFYDPRGPVGMFKTGHGKSAITKPMVKIRNISFEDYEYETPFIIEFIRELREKFLTSNIKAMMGYVVNQASLYSFKGERLNVTREAMAIFKLAADARTGDKVGDILYEDPWFALKTAELSIKYPKYFKQTVYDNGGGDSAPCFTILEKVIPFSDRIEHSLRVLTTIESKYGARAEQASESNVDWKATMHALRIVDEGLQILSTHKLAFPFDQSYVDHLLSIRRGELPLDPIKEELSTKLDQLKELERTTTLPVCDEEFKKTFDVWMAQKLRKIYNI